MLQLLLQTTGHAEGFDHDFFITFIDRLGVPIAMCAVLGYMLYRLIERNQKKEDSRDAAHQSLMSEHTNLIIQSSLSMDRVTGALGDTTKAIDKQNDNFERFISKMEDGQCPLARRGQS